MIVRRLITVMEYKVDQKSERRTESSIGRIKKVAGALAAVFATGVVARGIRRMISLGSDAAETLNVINEAFQEQSDSVLEWAKVQSQALGRSEFMLREYAATLGAMLTPMVEVPFVSARMSKTLAGLTVDLASFFNAAEPDVLAALKSGIVGQSEPLRRFGVVMTQAALDAFALENGIRKSVKEMTEAEKVTLRYQFILAKTTQAQGDAARTAGGFANLSKSLHGELTDLGTEIGLVLLPAATKFLAVLVGIVREVKGPVIGGIQRATRVLGAFANVTTLVMAGITAAAIALKAFGVQAILSWLAATAPAIAFIALLGLIGLAIFAVIEDLRAMGEGGRSVIGGLISEFQLWLKETDSVVVSIGRILLTAFKFWGESFASLFGDEVEAEFDRLVGHIDDFLKRVTRFFRDEISLADLIWGEDATLDEFVTNLRRDIADLTGIGRAEAQPAAAAVAAAQGVTAQQSIEVNVQAAPGMNENQLAETTGAAVGRGVDAANRRTAQRLAVGGGA